jgi:enamine deaminase RidA (YjgF/YER057c/UK114 family)
LENAPAATLMVVPGLANPAYQVEYEVIGVIDRSAADWGVTYYPEYWGGKKLAYPHVPMEHAKFARTEVVGNLVIVSGCQALDHDTVKVETADFKEQTRIVLDKIKIGLEETGGSLDTLAKTVVFLKNLDDLRQYREVEHAYFQAHAPNLAENPPASTAMIVSELPRPEFLVEVEAFGVADNTGPAWTMKNYPGGKYAAAAVSAGNLLFLSGCDGSDPRTGDMASDGVEQQVTQALDKVRTAMEEAESSMAGVVKTTMMLRNIDDYPKMRKTELEYYEKHAPHLVSNPPVSTFVQLPAITSPEALFQIDVTGVL